MSCDCCDDEEYYEMEIYDLKEDVGRLQDTASKLATENETLRTYVEELAGRDCDQYHKILSPIPCGHCASCNARAVLGGLEQT